MRRKAHEILEVDANASESEIKSRYRELARRFHPDVNDGEAGAERTFKQIVAAYEELTEKGGTGRRNETSRNAVRETANGGNGVSQAAAETQRASELLNALRLVLDTGGAGICSGIGAIAAATAVMEGALEAWPAAALGISTTVLMQAVRIAAKAELKRVQKAATPAANWPRAISAVVFATGAAYGAVLTRLTTADPVRLLGLTISAAHATAAAAFITHPRAAIDWLLRQGRS